jgi:hypothetical protein
MNYGYPEGGCDVEYELIDALLIYLFNVEPVIEKTDGNITK